MTATETGPPDDAARGAASAQPDLAGAPRALLFLFFFVSGACSLLYQVVWLRLAFASFGVVTPVLSVVVSVFMAGLFVGSWFGARWLERSGAPNALSAIWYYAAAELVVGGGALAVPALFELGARWILPSGESGTTLYLLTSATAILIAIAPWCVAMGTTFPFMMTYLRERDRSARSGFSFLYLANVLGAMFGTLASALVLVELLGFRDTLRLGAAGNISMAAAACALGWSELGGRRRERGRPPAALRGAVERERWAPVEERGATRVLFATGLCAMGSEVAWVRGFTPVLGTQVYSFALLLFGYLLATWIGSALYRRDLRRRRAVETRSLVAWVAAAALLPIALADPRLDLRAAGALLGILPFCGLLGYLTPRLIDAISGGDPRRAGHAYAINVAGCILGPLVASYLLLPNLGVRLALGLLAAPYFLLLLRPLGAGESAFRPGAVLAGAALAVVLVGAARSYEDLPPGAHGQFQVRRDSTATVISLGAGLDKQLLVNGIGMTALTTTTKVMSHLPLASLAHPPKKALAICFGMGTSWRSILSWGIDGTAVELIPSVREAFPYYFDDASRFLAMPNGRIVIDDGRRFLERTSERYDVIVVDPPPPIVAAGSSLLYSEEFYELARRHLTADGILQQWFPATGGRTLSAVTLSLERSFPYLAVFRAYDGTGYHLLASEAPIPVLSAEELLSHMPPAAVSDLGEWLGAGDVRGLLSRVGAGRREPAGVVGPGRARITDDSPYNEYFLLRVLRWRMEH